MPCGQLVQGTSSQPAISGVEGHEDFHVGQPADRIRISDLGFPGHRPSGPPSAAQRRTIGLPPNRHSRTGTLYREGCPAAPLCWVDRAAGATSPSTMACPARPGERCISRVLVGAAVSAARRVGFTPPSVFCRQVLRHHEVERSSRDVAPTLKCDAFVPVVMVGLRALCDATLR